MSRCVTIMEENDLFDELPFYEEQIKLKYKCYSVAMLPGNERPDLERGGKIIMPPSALSCLTECRIENPWLFKLVNRDANRSTHCGVLEFIGTEGNIFLPNWMMKNLLLKEGDNVEVECAYLSVATYARFQPQTCDFLNITNQKAVMENTLRNFACLTTGDMFTINYNNKNYEILVLETKPEQAVSILECDMRVDFATPRDYVEPKEVKKEAEELLPVDEGFAPFSGEGKRLDGKDVKKDTKTRLVPAAPVRTKRGIPDFDYKRSKIRFLHNAPPPPKHADNTPPEFKPFFGKGQRLKPSENETGNTDQNAKLK